MAQPKARVFSIAVIGVGGVGTAFVSQLEALSHRYLSSPHNPVRIHLVYVSRSSKAYYQPDFSALSFGNWSSSLSNASAAPLAAQALATKLAALPGHAVVVDNTSSLAVGESYPVFLEAGISVITPNKKAFSSDYGLWEAIFSSAANGTGPQTAGAVFHESTVGACMPIISTLKDLLETGDVVTHISGVFSGTLSFLFNNFMPSPASGGAAGGDGERKLFSAEVKKAKDLGYTEPDPRDDLNGMDVARKLTILARLCGIPVASPSAFPVQSLIPKELESVKSADEFVSRLSEFDDQIAKVQEEARQEGKVLRYVGTIDIPKGALEVGLQKFDASSPIANLKATDGIISFQTKRYGPQPLVIQGAGAGGEPTAMGVTADLIKVINYSR